MGVLLTCIDDVGLNKGRSRFLKVSDAFVFFLYFCTYANLIKLDHVIRMYLVKILLLIVSQGPLAFRLV
jgi:hypothetical protein